jgi:hypothetical protein
VVALRHGRRFIGLELNPQYAQMARRRVAGPLFAQGEPSPALSRGQVEAEGLRDLRPEPEALESAPGLAGFAKEGT